MHPQRRLLGGFELATGSRGLVAIARKNAHAWLADLACRPGQSQPRDKLDKTEVELTLSAA